MKWSYSGFLEEEVVILKGSVDTFFFYLSLIDFTQTQTS